MPFYEFYCPDCHTVFNFFSRRVNTETRPDCPACGRVKIERRPSLFGISRGIRESEQDDAMPDIDEARVEKAFEAMAGELDKVDEEDPRAMGRMMRQLFDAAGLKMGAGMEEAMQRMEAGEDPERIDQELGDAMESEDPLQSGFRPSLKELRRRYLPPRVDDKLYELE
jgi:putative FmdB family regulatory protein